MNVDPSEWGNLPHSYGPTLVGWLQSSFYRDAFAFFALREPSSRPAVGQGGSNRVKMVAELNNGLLSWVPDVLQR